MDQPTPVPRSRRRWFQYSLRTLLVFVLVASVGCGCLANQARREREAIAWVEKMGGYVGYDHEAQNWWRKLLRFPEPVFMVNIYGKKVNDLSPLAELNDLEQLRLSSTNVSDLSPLAGLKNLYEVDLDETKVSDLSPLAGLKSLERIHLDYTKVGDLSPLAGLKKLFDLSLVKAEVTEEQVQRLHKALPKCKIFR
ncbi:MAG: hypothetical protein K8T25_16565 [Planctomycetia bacterium]|nr:hypothetical protein [Planctomycetia bacterium]